MRTNKMNFTENEFIALARVIESKLDRARKSALEDYNGAMARQEGKAATEARNNFKSVPTNATAIVQQAIGKLAVYGLDGYQSCEIYITSIKEPTLIAHYISDKGFNFTLGAVYRDSEFTFTSHS